MNPHDHTFVPLKRSQRALSIMRKHYLGLRSTDNRCELCLYPGCAHPTAKQLRQLQALGFVLAPAITESRS